MNEIMYFHEHHMLVPSDELIKLQNEMRSSAHLFGAAHSVPNFLDAKYDYKLLLPVEDDFQALQDNLMEPSFWEALKVNKTENFKTRKEQEGESNYYATIFAIAVAKDITAFDNWKKTFGRSTITKAELVHGIRYIKTLEEEYIPSLDIFIKGCTERIKEMCTTTINKFPDGLTIGIQVPGMTTKTINSLDELVADASMNMNNPTVHNKVLFDFLTNQEEETTYDFNYVVRYSTEPNKAEAYVFFNENIQPLYLIGDLNSDLQLILRTLEPRDQDAKPKLIL